MVALSPAAARVAAYAVSPALESASSAAADAFVTCAFCCPTSRARPLGAPALSAMAYAACSAVSVEVAAFFAAAA